MTVSKSLRTISENLTDARCACHVKIPLFDVAAAGVSAVLCGAKNLSEIMEYLEYHGDYLKSRFKIKRLPSESTLLRVLKAPAPQELGEATRELMREAIGRRGNVIAVEGKAIRSAEAMKRMKRGLRVLSAYETQSGLTLGRGVAGITALRGDGQRDEGKRRRRKREKGTRLLHQLAPGEK